MKYSKRMWLTPPGTDSTATVASYHDEEKSYLEISDCFLKIRLHQVGGMNKDKKVYIKKLKRLNGFIDEFIDFLEEESV